MPTIYLEHPVHGTKVATLDIEADFDEQNGWKRYTLDTPSLVEEAASQPEEVNALAPAARRGRPRKAVNEGE
jgi:hypothetical protein